MTTIVQTIATMEYWIPAWFPAWMKTVAIQLVLLASGLIIGLNAGIHLERSRSATHAERQSIQRGWMNSEEASVVRGVSQRTVIRWAADGRIEGAVKVAGQWRFPIGFGVSDKSDLTDTGDGQVGRDG